METPNSEVTNHTTLPPHPVWVENIKVFSQSLSPRNVFGLIGLLVLIVGLFGGVVLALTNQENRSHASGTVTLLVDPTPQVDLTKKTITFLVRLIPSGNPLPEVAAVKLHMLIEKRNFSGVVQFVSFALHDPKVFPLESDNPSGIPPFSTSPSDTPTNTPFPTLGPGCHTIQYPCDPVKIPDGRWQSCPTSQPTIVCPSPTGLLTCGGNVKNPPTCPSGYICKYTNGVADVGGTCIPISPSVVSPTPCSVYNPHAKPQGTLPPCVFPSPTVRPVLGAQDAVQGAPIGQSGDNNVEAGQESGHLYYSVGQLYAKTIHQPVTLTDITYAITLPVGSGGGLLQQSDIDSVVQKLNDGSLTISFAPDTEVYGINPSGDPKNPFVKISFTTEPATFSWENIFHTQNTPTLTITKAPTPTPCLVHVGGVYKPCENVTSTPGSKVTRDMIIACMDLDGNKYLSSPRYNSVACKAYPNRAEADINHDGYINEVDLNLFFRQTLTPTLTSIPTPH